MIFLDPLAIIENDNFIHSRGFYYPTDFILQIGQLNKKIDNARELMLNDDISSADYRLIKEQCDEILRVWKPG